MDVRNSRSNYLNQFAPLLFGSVYQVEIEFPIPAVQSITNLVKMARLKHELKAAPAYAYYFTWQTQILDGVAGAWHTAELQFCFDNTKRCEQGTGNSPKAQSLAKRMASSWAAFAATGNPSIPGLTWVPTDPKTNRTMIWDNECRMADHPEKDARSIILA